MMSEKDSRLICGYLDNLLTKDELSELINRLQEDEDLRELWVSTMLNEGELWKFGQLYL